MANFQNGAATVQVAVKHVKQAARQGKSMLREAIGAIGDGQVFHGDSEDFSEWWDFGLPNFESPCHHVDMARSTPNIGRFAATGLMDVVVPQIGAIPLRMFSQVQSFARLSCRHSSKNSVTGGVILKARTTTFFWALFSHPNWMVFILPLTNLWVNRYPQFQVGNTYFDIPCPPKPAQWRFEPTIWESYLWNPQSLLKSHQFQFHSQSLPNIIISADSRHFPISGSHFSCLKTPLYSLDLSALACRAKQTSPDSAPGAAAPRESALSLGLSSSNFADGLMVMWITGWWFGSFFISPNSWDDDKSDNNYTLWPYGYLT